MPKSINTKSDVNAGHNYIICTKIYNYAPLKKCFPPYKISEKNLVIYAFWQKIQKLKKKKIFWRKREKKSFGDKLTSLCAKYLIVSVIFTCLYNSRMYKEKIKSP